jgi:uncharacterized protein
MDIEFDPDKAQSNLRKHKVSFSDAEQALRDPFAVTIKDPDSGTSNALSHWAWIPLVEF